jgi:phosphoglycerate dehydrogenase-like enzyme
MHKAMPTVLFSAPYMIPSLDRFRPILDRYGLELIVPQVVERLDEKDLLSYAGQFDGAICGDDRFSARVLEACVPRLKVISKWGTGIDSIDQVAAERLGVKVYRTPNAFTLPVADTVMGYVLAFARRQPWMDRAMKNGRWEKVLGRSLSECTLGVVGVGRIGKAVIHRAHAFDMQILGNDIIEIDPNFLSGYSVRMVSLDELFSKSDFISLNCDLNPTSYHLVNQSILEQVKPGAVLINTARGPIVDESALIQALDLGKLSGAAMDVYENEPLPGNHSFLSMDQVMLAPHNANSSPTAWERVHFNTISNLLIGLGLSDDNLVKYFGGDYDS